MPLPELLAILNFGVAELILLPVMLGILAFWIWMLVDCLSHERESSDRILWVLLMLISGILGAAIYFFVRKVRRKPASP